MTSSVLRKPTRRISIAMAAALLGTTLISACSRQSLPGAPSILPGSATPHQLSRKELSEAQQKYGLAPIPDPSVTYQPDVILVGGGPEAIRNLSADGLVWTIDGSAPRAGELAPGKVMFMTGRAVGRVLDVRKDGANLAVVLGPIDITEVIREAHINIESMPVDFGQALAVTTPELPGQVVPFATLSPNAAPRPAMYDGQSGWGFYKTQASSTDAGPTQSYSEQNFKTTPFASPTSIGVDTSVDEGGFKLSAQAVLHLSAPRLKIQIDITPTGGVKTLALSLSGAAGLNWNFKTGSEKTMTAIVAALLQPNVDFVIPLSAVGGLPLAVTVRQRFLIRTALMVKNSTLSASGGYTFNGAFTVGYLNKNWTANAPNDFTTETSMTKTGAGLSLGVEGLTLSDTVRVFVGLGAAGFATGPYLSFNSAISSFRSSAIGMLACNGSSLVVNIGGGVGYIIPKSVVKLINSVLRALNIKYEIVGEGGIEGPSKTVIQRSSQIGGCKMDKDPNEKGTVRGGP